MILCITLKKVINIPKVVWTIILCIAASALMPTLWSIYSILAFRCIICEESERVSHLVSTEQITWVVVNGIFCVSRIVGMNRSGWYISYNFLFASPLSFLRCYSPEEGYRMYRSKCCDGYISCS